MNDLSPPPDVKTCPHCGKKLRSDNTRGACSTCLAKPGRRSTKGGTDDSVLARMGFKTEADEPPPATKSKAKKRAAPAKVSAPVPLRRGRWEEQFRALGSALGLDPDEMLEEHCRQWVESTRTRALAVPADPSRQLPSGPVEG